MHSEKPRGRRMLDNKSILITGGTGSFGQKLVRRILARHDNCRVVVYSRDEMKQWNMANDFADHPKRHLLRFFLGDVRDKDRLHRAFSGIDYVVHAAALKIVPAAEYNPFEFIKTNINGAMNVIDCAIDQGVRRVIALSTDKACNPINLYGATKLCSDKLFVAGNSYSGAEATRFAVVRYGNVMGSRGSVIPLFRSLRDGGELPITDAAMTRFMITLEQAVEMVLHAMKNAVGGEIYVKKIPSMRVVDIARAVAPEAKLKIVGIRPGEKMHEQMISPEDAATTYEYSEYFKILPNIHNWKQDPNRIKDGKKCEPGFCYSSEHNKSWMTDGELKAWLAQEYSQPPAKGTAAAGTRAGSHLRKLAAAGG
jgi:UDP-N-acetylglucosamine 4,6-dehydratase/5-epimerase